MGAVDQYKIQIANLKVQLASTKAAKMQDKARRQMQIRTANPNSKPGLKQQLDMAMMQYDNRINQLKIQIENTKAMMARARATGM